MRDDCMCMQFRVRLKSRRMSTVGKLPCTACGEWNDHLNHEGLCVVCKSKIEGIIKISQVEAYDDGG